MQTTITTMTLEATESFSLSEVEESTGTSASDGVGEVEGDKARTGIRVGLEVVEISVQKRFEREELGDTVGTAVGSMVTDGVL